jgi:hypothetical protein
MSHKGNDEIIDNERDNIMSNKEYNGTGESDEKYLEGEHHDLTTYYEMIKQFEYLLESENYQDQVYSFIIGHFEKHLTEDLLQELKDSLRL